MLPNYNHRTNRNTGGNKANHHPDRNQMRPNYSHKMAQVVWVQVWVMATEMEKAVVRSIFGVLGLASQNPKCEGWTH
jgi:hypothetical protein